MLLPSIHLRRSRPLALRSHEFQSLREETALFSVHLLSGARGCWVYSSAKAVNSEVFIGEAGRDMDAAVPCPCPRLEISTVPPFARTKVDAIQKPRPEPGMVA